jgi:hypothetical protein
MAGPDVEPLDLQPVADQRREHIGVAAEPLLEVSRRVTGLKDCKLHGVRLAT